MTRPPSPPDLNARLREVRPGLPIDAKCDPARRDGPEGWYRYYAGYSEDFARGILRELADGDRLRVLDPWNGSGTTTRIAHELGHHAFGFDLNPVANLVAIAKLANPDDALHVAGLTRRLADSAPHGPDTRDPLSRWMAPSVVAQHRAIERGILAELATTTDGIAVDPRRESLPPLAAFLLLALLSTSRRVASVRRGTNPTWTVPDSGVRRRSRTLGSQWTAEVQRMAHELNEVRGATTMPWTGTIATADARVLPMNDSTVDLVLTSPPYCTRIDYFVSSSFEMAALGVDTESGAFKDLRRGQMGTPLARPGAPPTIRAGWPEVVKRLLRTIRKHPSKASRSYYYKTYWQYFSDAEASLRELNRVVRPGGTVLIVVQNSYYKEVGVDLPEIYAALGGACGFHTRVLGETPVRRALAQIHPHSLHHRQNSTYREAVVAMERT